MFDKNTMQLLYRYCYSLTCNDNSAYDLLQGALEKFIKSNTTARQPEAFIKKIIHNQFVDDYRKEKRVQLDVYDEDTLTADFDIQTLENLMIKENLVEKIFQYLEPDEREIIYFWAIEGLSASEIASQLEIPRGTILSKIYRMRKKLIAQFDANSNMAMEVMP